MWVWPPLFSLMIWPQWNWNWLIRWVEQQGHNTEPMSVPICFFHTQLRNVFGIVFFFFGCSPFSSSFNLTISSSKLAIVFWLAELRAWSSSFSSYASCNSVVNEEFWLLEFVSFTSVTILSLYSSLYSWTDIWRLWTVFKCFNTSFSVLNFREHSIHNICLSRLIRESSVQMYVFWWCLKEWFWVYEKLV